LAADLSYTIIKEDRTEKVVMGSINRIVRPAENHVFGLYAGRPLNGQRLTWDQPLIDP
jgi:hypothetical protein